MARYLLSVFTASERTPFGPYSSREEMLTAFADTGAFNADLEASGRLVFADGLQPSDTAVVVDGRAPGASEVVDGPYLHGPESFSGFWVIEADDDAHARETAARASKACRGKVEVRPFHTEASIGDLLD